MSPVVAVLGQLPALLAAILVATDRQIVRRLRAAGATHAAGAVSFHPPRPFGGMRLRRMVAAGAVGETAGPRYYLDHPGYDRWRAARRRRGLTVVAVLLALGGVLYAAGFFR